MNRFEVHVQVMPRASLLDPQGQAVEHALTALGFDGVRDVRVGKALTLNIAGDDRRSAEAAARQMCERLLANPVTEDFTVTVRGAS